MADTITKEIMKEDLEILIRYHKGEEMSDADMTTVKRLIYPSMARNPNDLVSIEEENEIEARLAKEASSQCPLTEALRLTTGPRQEAYGHPFVNFTNIARGWTVILGIEVYANQVALCMMWTKMCRELNVPAFDNEVDIAGYVNTLHMIKERK